MHPNITIMSLHLIISIFLLLLPPSFSGHPVAKPGCQERCGNLAIPYPFGVGWNCSREPSFDITCNTSTVPPRAYLSIMNKEVIEFNETYIRVSSPFLISACYDMSDRYQRGTGTNATGETEAYNYKHSSMSMNLSGTPYTLSDGNRLITIGCDDAVLLYNGSSVSRGCSAFCGEENDRGSVGYCPYNATSLGSGCCDIFTYTGTRTFLRAHLMNLSGKLGRRKLFPCSYAFIQESPNDNETAFSYPLYYLDNSTALLNDNWASASRPPVVRLDWMVGAENCSRAKKNPTTYACRDDKSVCVDDDQYYHYYGETARGYLCSCVPGYEGNPYLPGGCQAISFSSSIAKHGCPDQCGKLFIPFPFGIGRNCYLAPSFEIICNTSTNPPVAYLRVLDAEIIELNSSLVVVNYPNIGLACYNSSETHRGITKTEERSLVIDLSSTQYTLSDKNWITTIGCDDVVVGVIAHANQSSIGTSCASVCRESRITSGNAYCPAGRTSYYPGDGCCRAPIPRGTSHLEANLSDFSGRWPRTNFSCSYTFIQYYNYRYDNLYYSFPILNNSTEMTLNALLPSTYWGSSLVNVALDWRVGMENCNQAQRKSSTFACTSDHSTCVDFDATAGGYLCNCSKGYQGNPYIVQGCRDVDECADNPCEYLATCINTPGSFKCPCPKGYFGDGMKDGSGCIHQPKSKTKMIILTGVVSGLGFLLLLLMSFWLYKMLQRRKEKMLKDKFFKRNGGLLLRQQTNEGSFGKTKVFLANELEVATDNFNSSRILGHGGQGIVYKGMLSDGKIVAIKKSKLVEENQLEQFINEVVILSQINHRNVVKLLGCCLETEVPLLVYEYMPNGTLFDLIHDPNNEFPFPWIMRLKTASDIAGALAYLHSASSMPIYHRDIKSSNILLDDKFVVKVSDFGTSRSIATDQTHLTTMVKGTFGYLDPEYFQSSQFTEKSDVYSFGVVLVELLTGQRPISLDKTEDERSLATRFLTSMERNLLDTILDPRILEQDKKEEVRVVARLAQRCLNLKGKMRPTMKEVATELESFRISHMSVGVKNEGEDPRGFEDMPTAMSDIEYTWTGSYRSGGPSSLDSHPLIFTTE